VRVRPEAWRRGHSAHLALVHHANQYVIGEGYADRQGMSEILGLRGPAGEPAGLLPLLRMHLEHRVPLNLHCSGTLLEALAWHCPQAFSFLKRLRRAGLLELIGGAFSQNVMPFFSETVNRRQVNEELALYRRHLQWDLRQVRCFWVPERVWDTRLAALLRSSELLNGGYRHVLLDDRLVHAGGESYAGSARERFDRERPLELESFLPWEIADGGGLVMLPISRDLRYAIPPFAPEALERLGEILGWMAASGDERALAIYGDDLEKAAGVGGWDPLHPRRYEQFLQWLRERSWIRPVLLSEWARGRAAAGVRTIERGTFYELARCWRAGEDYRGWYDDPNCAEHRRYLTQAEQALRAAEERGADAALLELGWMHLLHCCYETSWHDPRPGAGDGGERSLAGWAAALTSHARSCILLSAAAEWAARRDGTAHAELVDLDADGDLELVVKNRHLLAVFSPRWGGRLTHLFDLTGRGGRLVIGNVSDDWNLQEELNRYMDCPANHPGALVEVGHEHDRYEATLPAPGGGESAVAVLRNVEPGSPLRGTEKRVTLGSEARHLAVVYSLSPGVRRLSAEACLSPDYRRLLRGGRDGLEAVSGPRWRGWRNGSACAWVRIDPRQWTVWDAPRHAECGHGLNLRITALASPFEVHVGVGTPAGDRVARAPRPARFVPSPPAADARFMRRFLSRNLPEGLLPVRECRIRILKPHHDRLTLQYDLGRGRGPRRAGGTLVGTWRADGRGQQMYDLLRSLRQAGMNGRHGLSVPRPLAYWKSLHLLLLEKARGRVLRQWIYGCETDWPRLLRPVSEWLAALHALPVDVPERLDPVREIQRLRQWGAELSASPKGWLVHERRRIESLVDLIESLLDGPRSSAPCLTHGDFHPENVLMAGTAVVAIDFEHACMADPARDVGFLLAQIEIQRDRYWRRRGRDIPAPPPRLTAAVVDPYRRARPAEALTLVPVYRAQTFLQHLAHTVRMKGTEDPRSVTHWLDRAGEYLGTSRYRAMRETWQETAAVASGLRT
jgi:aminoglycoside phosphotransferase (APT) family kinase protein